MNQGAETSSRFKFPNPERNSDFFTLPPWKYLSSAYYCTVSVV